MYDLFILNYVTSFRMTEAKQKPVLEYKVLWLL